MCSLYSFLKEYIFVYACSRWYDCSYIIVFTYLYAGGRAFVLGNWRGGICYSSTPAYDGMADVGDIGPFLCK